MRLSYPLTIPAGSTSSDVLDRGGVSAEAFGLYIPPLSGIPDITFRGSWDGVTFVTVSLNNKSAGTADPVMIPNTSGDVLVGFTQDECLALDLPRYLRVEIDTAEPADVVMMLLAVEEC